MEKISFFFELVPIVYMLNVHDYMIQKRNTIQVFMFLFMEILILFKRKQNLLENDAL